MDNELFVSSFLNSFFFFMSVLSSDEFLHSLIRQIYTLENVGINITQRWVKYGQTQRLGSLDLAVGLLPI